MKYTSTISPMLKIGLQFLGLWPGVPYSTLYWLIYVTSIVLVQYFQYFYVYTHLKLSELSNLMDSLPATLDYTLTLFKVIILWIQRRFIHQILVMMDNDWRECVEVDQHLYLMTMKASISHFCFNVMFTWNTTAGIFYFLGDYVLHFAHLTGYYNITSRHFPIKIQFPFETEQSPIFELLAVALSIHVMLNVFTMTIVNALIASLVLHVSGQIEIMCQEFKNFSERILHYGSSTSTLGMLIQRHNRVILFSDHVENLYSFIALMQVVWATLVICSLGFMILISFDNETGAFMIMRTSMAYIGITVEAFITCCAGEYLSFKSKSIGDAAYASEWYYMPSHHSKVICFIIMRSQKRLMITAGKMTNLTLEAFTSIMKASVSYISVLHAMD